MADETTPLHVLTAGNERNGDLSTVEVLPQKRPSVDEHVQDNNREGCSGSHCQHRDY